MNAQEIVDQVRFNHPLVQPSEHIDTQIKAIRERGKALDLAMGLFSQVWDEFPRGLWEQNEELRCLCAQGPSGHQVGCQSGCLFGDGETRHSMCASCRRPCDVEVKPERCFQGYYGSAPAYENLMEIRSACCKDAVLLPNGVELEEYEDA